MFWNLISNPYADDGFGNADVLTDIGQIMTFLDLYDDHDLTSFIWLADYFMEKARDQTKA